jgi:hypothetical protein
MQSVKGLSCPLVLLALMTAPAARAQTFSPANNPFSRAAPGVAPRKEQLQFGAYLTVWDFSPIRVPGVQSEKLQADPGPLITGDYFVTRCLSLGGWWNPFSGEVEARETPRGRAFKVADSETSFWNVHATYYPPEHWARGWSIQAGFSHLRHNVDVIQGLREVGVPNFAVNSSSLDIWLNRTQKVGFRRVQDQRVPISLFASAGYYTSSQFDRAVNVIVGGSLPMARHLSLNSSVWFNSLDRTNTRVTAGLAGSF